MERIAMDPAAAHALFDTYLRVADALDAVAARLRIVLDDAAAHVVVDPAAVVGGLTAVARQLVADAADLRWRLDLLATADVTVLAEGHAGNLVAWTVPSGPGHADDAALVYAVIGGTLADFDAELGGVYRGEDAAPVDLSGRWPDDAATRFDFSNDACSSPVGNVAWGYDFTLACYKHDFGYRNLKHLDERYNGGEPLHWNPDSRGVVDGRFAEDLADVCASEEGLDFTICSSAAEAYVHAVQFGGDGFQWHDLDDAAETVAEYLWPFN